ncbi:hypothetical protein [Haloarchaeobius amylolyticus]|uniref:hypothetical protein n=1 Tax=Haloarchaeobius amylolyticus TaxID=1198296 RepID=UPI00226FA006|nr:hypothetical protein [Haloarchaeobius amylolyticus]
MSDHATPPATDVPPTFEQFSDLQSLADEVDADYRETPNDHESESHCEAEYAGRAIAGITDEQGRLLLMVHEPSGKPLMPNVKVEGDEAWLPPALAEIDHLVGLAVEFAGTERIRRVDHHIEGSDEVFESTTHVVFRAVPAAGPEDRPEPSLNPDAIENDDVDPGDFTVDWFASIPGDESGMVEADAALFLE